jgi:hypothetical protein
MKEIEFDLELNGINFQNLSLKNGDEFEIAKGIKVKYEGPKIARYSEETPWIFAFKIIIDSGVTVGLGVISAWLYDKFHNRTHDNKITFRKRTTEFDKGEIQKIIEEELEIK